MVKTLDLPLDFTLGALWCFSHEWTLDLKHKAEAEI
jgi:hypothetical protein